MKAGDESVDGRRMLQILADGRGEGRCGRRLLLLVG
jgi:hypothetical protein